MTRPLVPISFALLGCLLGCSPISISPASLVATATPLAIEVAAFVTDSGVINGTVKDSNDGEPIANALVILSCDCLDTNQERYTNERGLYSFSDLPQGNYTIQVLAGKANIAKVTELPEGAKFKANFSIDPGVEAVRVIVVEAAPVVQGTTSTGVKIGMEEAKKLPVGSSSSRDFTAVVDLAPTATRDAAGISLAGTTGAESKHVDSDVQAQTSFGTLTVATIDDNRERRSLAELARGLEAIPDLQDRGGVSALTSGRTVLRVVDRTGRPVSDAIIRAEHGQLQFTLRTGTDGKAVLAPRWDLGAEQGKVELEVEKGQVEREVRLDIGHDDMTITLPIDHDPTVQTLDLALIVDVTGSMGDELSWLQVELHRVIAKVLAEHPNVDARVAVIAYRDHGDEFEVVSRDFTDDLDRVDTFLGWLSANGGGDYPELMDEALVAADGLRWRDEGAKVALLIADAPPHPDRIAATLAASDGLRETGVSTYAIAASGTDPQSELLMRSIAALSASQYLSLTDDSGIGDSHADPHVSELTVETLEAALLRILRAELDGDTAAPASQGKRRKARRGDRDRDAGQQQQSSERPRLLKASSHRINESRSASKDRRTDRRPEVGGFKVAALSKTKTRTRSKRDGRDRPARARRVRT